MIEKNKLRLCGGTYFSCLWDANKSIHDSVYRPKNFSDVNEISQKKMLTSIAEMIIEGYSTAGLYANNIGNATSRFKACDDKGGRVFPFGENMPDFNRRIKEEYEMILEKMHGFCEAYFCMEGNCNQNKTLVKHLMAFIILDETIKDDQMFYVLDDGTPIKKSEMKKKNSFCFEAFLLGVLHYAMNQDNKVGKDICGKIWPSNRKQDAWTIEESKAYKQILDNEWKIELILTYYGSENRIKNSISGTGKLKNVIIEQSTDEKGTDSNLTDSKKGNGADSCFRLQVRSSSSTKQCYIKQLPWMVRISSDDSHSADHQ